MKKQDSMLEPETGYLREIEAISSRKPYFSYLSRR